MSVITLREAARIAGEVWGVALPLIGLWGVLAHMPLGWWLGYGFAMVVVRPLAWWKLERPRRPHAA